MQRLPIRGLDPSEGTEGQVLARVGNTVAFVDAVGSSDTPPTAGQTLVWDGSAWVPGDAAPPTAVVPLTTTVNGVPELVWESDGSLALTEVPR